MYCNVLGWMDRRGDNKEAASCRAGSLAILDLAPFFDYFPQGRPRHSRSMCSRSTAARPRISLAAHLGAHSHSSEAASQPHKSTGLVWLLKWKKFGGLNCMCLVVTMETLGAGIGPLVGPTGDWVRPPRSSGPAQRLFACKSLPNTWNFFCQTHAKVCMQFFPDANQTRSWWGIRWH